MPRKIYTTALILPLFPPFVDLDKLIAIFDADDTVWPAFAPAAEIAGVDPSKLDNFVVQDSPHYTAEEKARLFEAFRDIRLVEQAVFYPGIEKMATLHELGIHIGFDSKSWSKRMADSKRCRFKEAMPFLQDSDLNLTISGQDHAATGKKIGKEVTFFIDDNPYNIITSDAVYNLVPCKTWNCSPEETHRMRGKNFYLFNSLDNILETIIRSVRFWRANYSIL